MEGKGFIGLSDWYEEGLALQIERHNAEVRQRLRDRLHTMSPADFEALIRRLLVALGFDEVEITPYGGDGGIDVRGTLVVGDVIRTRMAVQVKRWRHNVQAPTVQQVRGSWARTNRVSSSPPAISAPGRRPRPRGPMRSRWP
jgi:restriction system protein